MAAEVIAEGVVLIGLRENLAREMAAAEAKVAAGMKAIDAQEAELHVKNEKALAALDELKAREKKALADLERAQKDSDKRLGAAAQKRLKRAQAGLGDWYRDNAALNTKLVALDKKRTDLTIAAERRVATARQAIAREQQKQHDKNAREDAKAAAAANKRADALNQESDNVKQLTARYAELARKRRGLVKREEKVTTSRPERLSIQINREGVEEQMLNLRRRLIEMNADPIHVDVDVDTDNDALGKFARTLSETSLRLGPFTTTIGNTVRILATMGPVIMGLVSAVSSLAAVTAGAAVGAIGALGAAFAGFLPLAVGTGMSIAPLVGDFKKATDASEALYKAQVKYGKGSDEAKKAQEQLQTTLKNVDPAARKAAKGLGQMKRDWDMLTQDAARKSFGKVIGSSFEAANKLMPMFAANTNKFMDVTAKGLDGWMDRLSSAGGQKGLNTLFDNINNSLGPLMGGLESLGAVVGRVLVGFSNHLPRIAHGFEDWANALDETTSKGDGIKNFVDTTMNSLSSLWGLLKGAGRVVKEFFRAAIDGPRDAAPGIKLIDDLAGSLNRLADRMGTVEGQDKLREFFSDFNGVARDAFDAFSPFVKLFYEWATLMRPLITPLLKIVELLGDMVQAVANFGPTRLMLQSAFGLFLAGTLASKVGGLIKLFSQLRGVIKEVGAMGAGLKALDWVTGGGLPWFKGKGRGPAGRLPGGGVTLPPVLPTPARRVPAPTAGTRPASSWARGGGSVASKGVQQAGSSAVKTAAQIGGVTAASTAATAAVGTFGAAATIAATGGLALLGGAVGYGVYKLITHEDASEKARKNVVKLGEAGKVAGQNYYGLAKANSDVGLGMMQSNLSLKQAKQALDGTKKGTDANRQAMINYRMAMISQQNQQELWNKQKREQIDASNDQRDADNERFREFQKGEGKNIASLRERIAWDKKRIASGELSGQMEKDYRKNLKEAQEELGPLEAQERRLLALREKSRNRAAATAMNIAREYRGLPAVLGNAEQALGKLARANKPLAKKISLTYEAPKDVGRVAAQAQRQISRGASPKQVMKIIASTKGAENDIRRLDNLGDRAVRKKREMTLKALDKASGTVRAVMRNLGLLPRDKNTDLKATNKATGIIGSVIQKLASVPSVRDTVLRSVAPGVVPFLDGIRNAVNSIPSSKTVNVAVNAHKAGAWGGALLSAASSLLGFATGGTTKGSRGALPSMQERAQARASVKAPMPNNGGIVRGPRLLVGEETTHEEYVIATNPAYRDRNKKLVAAAANDLGLTVIGGETSYRNHSLADDEFVNGVRAAAKGALPSKKKKDGYTKKKGWYDPTPNSGARPKPEPWYLPKGWSVGGQQQIIGPGWVPQRNGIFVPTKQFKSTNPWAGATMDAGAVGGIDPSVASEIQSQYESLSKKIRGEEERLSDMRAELKKMPSKKKKDKAKRRTKQKAIDRLEKQNKRNKAKQRKMMGKYTASNLNEAATGAIGRWEDKALVAQDQMAEDEITGALDQWYTHRTDRSAALEQVALLYGNAAAKAKEPFKTELKKRKEQAERDKVANDNASYGGQADARSFLSMEQAEQLRRIQADVALTEAGQGNQYFDSWKGLLDPADTTPTAGEALTSFWQQRLNEAISAKKGPDVIQAIATELGNARGNVGGAAEAAEATVTPGQMLNTERMNLLRDFASNSYGVGTQGTPGSTGPAGSLGNNPASLKDPYVGPDRAGSTNAASMADPYQGGDAMSAVARGSSAASTLSPRGSGGGSGTVVSGGGGAVTKNIYIKPTFANVPPDPHTFSRNVGYELGSVL